MTFFDLILHNVWRKKARSAGLALAVAIAVTAMGTLAVMSNGLEESAAAMISIGKADFTVVQKGASETLSSTVDRTELARIKGAASAVGVLVETQRINSENPVFIETDVSGHAHRIVDMADGAIVSDGRGFWSTEGRFPATTAAHPVGLLESDPWQSGGDAYGSDLRPEATVRLSGAVLGAPRGLSGTKGRRYRQSRHSSP